MATSSCGDASRVARGRDALLDTYPLNLEIVGTTGVCNSASRADPILSLATDLGTPCWYVRAELILALRIATGIQNEPLETTAALLACLPDARHDVIGIAPGGNLPLFPWSPLGGSTWEHVASPSHKLREGRDGAPDLHLQLEHEPPLGALARRRDRRGVDKRATCSRSAPVVVRAAADTS